ncbi:hypothetical protein [Streptomyces sp. NPDC127084]|uniref:hypothetical protein n=1 Tax=Streptomyces sp. NPDC127084 TaxID=3347133 RepID=UPI003665CE28
MSNATVMRVLRAELGIGLDGVKAVLEQVLSGQYSGTLPEMELLARKLRASGIDAVVQPPRTPSAIACTPRFTETEGRTTGFGE